MTNFVRTEYKALTPLPMKLWEIIFLHLEDGTLWVLAAVFNERCMKIILLSNGVAL
jgi:hypothetical protein